MANSQQKSQISGLLEKYLALSTVIASQSTASFVSIYTIMYRHTYWTAIHWYSLQACDVSLCIADELHIPSCNRCGKAAHKHPFIVLVVKWLKKKLSMLVQTPWLIKCLETVMLYFRKKTTPTRFLVFFSLPKLRLLKTVSATRVAVRCENLSDWKLYLKIKIL